jgi:hypothetical protein
VDFVKQKTWGIEPSFYFPEFLRETPFHIVVRRAAA